MSTTGKRVVLLAIITVICVGVGVSYARYALQRTSGSSSAAEPNPSRAGLAVLQQPHIVFKDTSRGTTFGQVAAVPLDSPGGERTLTKTVCERVYSVGSAGLCLSAKRGVVTHQRAHLLDASLKPAREVVTDGEPSRVRLSADGALAATTTFSAGHSYTSSSFSTITTIYDVKKAKALHNLETFSITRDGKPYTAEDVNVWGVTFKRDGDGFYATMASKNKQYLVEGSLRGKTLRTLKEGVECPSLSPDGKRIAYKARDDSPGFFGWRIHVLDLESGADYPLPTDRSIDDQVEWLNNDQVLYGVVRQVGYLETDVWVVPADGGGKPVVLIREAWSPAVVRTPAR